MTSYDELPYESRAHYANHPDRMAVVATMLGLDPPAVPGCRVLELGCAEGGNLLPMAVSLPGARIVGIDLSERQIERGREAAAALGLTNLDLRAMSVADVDDGLGTFDYILAHGLHSWVPPETQEAILRVLARNLAPDGVAMVSYNCHPGWRFRGLVREVLQHRTRHLDTPAEKVAYAREFVAFLAQNAHDATGGYGLLFQGEASLLAATPDSNLFHELFEEWNAPLYFHEMVSRAARHGLSYLGDPELRGMTLGELRPDPDDVLSSFASTFLEKEQLLDLLRNRPFRQSLFVKGDAPRRLVVDRIQRLWIRSKVVPLTPPADTASGEPWKVRTQDGEGIVRVDDPLLKAALLTLSRAAPRALTFDALADAVSAGGARRAAFGETLLKAQLHDLLELSASSAGTTGSPGPRPIASPVARWEAERCGTVTTLWHERLALGSLDRMVLIRLDGTRTAEATLAEIVEQVHRDGLLSRPDGGAVTDRAVVAELLGEAVPSSLANLTRSGVLVA